MRINRRSLTDEQIVEVGMKLLALARAGAFGKDLFGSDRGIYPQSSGWQIGRAGQDDTIFLAHVQAHAVAFGKVSIFEVPTATELWKRGGYSWHPETRKPPVVETVYNRGSVLRRGKAAGV